MLPHIYYHDKWDLPAGSATYKFGTSGINVTTDFTINGFWPFLYAHFPIVTTLESIILSVPNTMHHERMITHDFFVVKHFFQGKQNDKVRWQEQTVFIISLLSTITYINPVINAKLINLLVLIAYHWFVQNREYKLNSSSKTYCTCHSLTV